MLVLSRRIEEIIEVEHCGEKLVITICDVQKLRDDHKVRIGFHGPKSFHVLRSEVADAIRAKPVTRIAETEHD